MSLIIFNEVCLEFGDQKILTSASFTIDPGERVCLIGRNGTGKSTLINIISGEIQADEGEIQIKPNLRVSQLQQALPSEMTVGVYDYVKSGLSKLKTLIDNYHAMLELKSEDLRKIESLQSLVDESGGWNIDNQVERIITELQLPREKKLGELSGGWQRRAALGRALISQPEVLLLDEPTNHLDLSAIQWLEDKIYSFGGSLLFVTHDRAFMQRLATRILELDRGRLRSWPGSYRKYLADKEKLLEVESMQNDLFDKRLEQEETWIRQGLKARRTRNEGRVRTLKKMREEYAQREKPLDTVRIHIEEGEISGRKIIEMRNVSFGYAEETIINRLSLKIQRGDRIGLIGNNGVGKSTLVKLILGKLIPQSGTIKQGTNLNIACFDQLRKNLDPSKTVADIVGDGSDYIKINGVERHVIGYLKGFLFGPKRSMTKVGVLSGGEENRIILAKLFTQPSNLLILDEPTNDLDVETLEVLEQKLTEYNGTLIVVSHDREFLDNVITSTLVFEQNGSIQSYVGGYSDWMKRGKALLKEEDLVKVDAQKNESKNANKKSKATKLSYKLKLELEKLPHLIEKLEREVEQLHNQTRNSEFYGQPYKKIRVVLDALEESEKTLEKLTTRWAELEGMQTKITKQS